MLRRKFITLFVLTAALLMVAVACQPAGNEPGAPVEQPEATETPEEAMPESQYPAAIVAARQQLAADLGIEAEAITVASFEEREWPNACLGLPAEGEMCAEVITPGYLVVLNAEGEAYRARTNRDGSAVRFEDAAGEQGDLPAAAVAARQALAAELGVEAEAIAVASSEEREWPNACLGLPAEGEMCAEVITPGYLVVLNAEGETYRARTNRDGSAVRFEDAAGEQGDLPAAVVAARQALAERMSASPGEIEVIAYEEREWTDSCLGLGGPEESCLQVITPGWLVTLGLEGKVYEFRTDEAGNAVRAADQQLEKPGAGLPDPVVTFERSGGIAGDHVRYLIYPDGQVEKRTSLPDPSQPVELVAMAPEQVGPFVQELKNLGFVEIAGDYVPEETCCDRFFYTVTLRVEDEVYTIEALGGTEETPDAVWEIIDAVEQFIQDVSDTG